MISIAVYVVLTVCLTIIMIRNGVIYVIIAINKVLNNHQKKSPICCDENCFCWDVSDFIDTFVQKWAIKEKLFNIHQEAKDE